MTTAKKIQAVKRRVKTAPAAPAVAPSHAAIKPPSHASTKPAPRPSMPSAATIKPALQPPAKLATKPAEEKSAKAKKPKLVRDSFTIPKAEDLVLDELKQRAGRISSPAKKSELLRAGIKALAAMPDAAFLAALRAVPAIKTGRPSKT